MPLPWIDDGQPRVPAGMTDAGFRWGQDGISLLEITIALSIVGVLTMTSVPLFRVWKDQADLRGAATRVVDIMLKARMRSIVERRNYTVSVNYTADSCAASPSVGIAQQGGGVDLYADNTDPEALSLAGGNVLFRPDGSADATGFEAVYLKSTSTQVPLRYRVKVHGASGRVNLEKWAGGAWAAAY